MAQSSMLYQNPKASYTNSILQPNSAVNQALKKPAVKQTMAVNPATVKSTQPVKSTMAVNPATVKSTGSPALVATKPPIVSSAPSAVSKYTPTPVTSGGTPKDMFINSAVADTPTVTAPVVTTPTAAPDTTAPATTSGNNAYIDYLKTIYNPEQAKIKASAEESARARYQESINEKQRRDFEFRKAESERLDQAGGTTTGARQASNVMSRRNAEESADKALEEMAALRGYEGAAGETERYMAGLEKAYSIDAKTAEDDAKTLSIEDATKLGVPYGTTVGQAREKGIIPQAEEKKSTAPADVQAFEYYQSLSPEQKAIYDKFAGISGSEGSEETISKEYMSKKNNESIAFIDNLLGKVNNKTVGWGSLLSFLPGQAAEFKAQLKPLTSSIAQNQLVQMRAASKTGGALGNVSDREVSMLENSLGAIDRIQRPDQFKEQLNQIRESLSRWDEAMKKYGNEMSSGIAPDEEEYLRAQGFSDEEIRALSGSSFNSGGSGTNSSQLSQAISKQESNNNYSAVNKQSGALGKYQIMPATLKGLGYNVSSQQFLANPQMQEEAHGKLLAELNTRYKGDVDKILADYYGGPKMAKIIGTPSGDVPQKGGHPSINQYVAQVKQKLNLA